MFLCLTEQESGKLVLVNLSNVTEIKPERRGYTRIMFNTLTCKGGQSSVIVKEVFSEVESMVYNKQ